MNKPLSLAAFLLCSACAYTTARAPVVTTIPDAFTCAAGTLHQLHYDVVSADEESYTVKAERPKHPSMPYGRRDLDRITVWFTTAKDGTPQLNVLCETLTSREPSYASARGVAGLRSWTSSKVQEDGRYVLTSCATPPG